MLSIALFPASSLSKIAIILDLFPECNHANTQFLIKVVPAPFFSRVIILNSLFSNLLFKLIDSESIAISKYFLSVMPSTIIVGSSISGSFFHSSLI